MIKVKFTATDDFTNSKHKHEVECESDAWTEQLEAFFEFLNGQGYILTYQSFLTAFGGMVKERSDCFHKDYKEDK